MTALRALSAGPRAETWRFTGRVHSTLARACNIVLDDGRLVALFAAELANAPHAIRLDTPRDFVFTRALRPGARVGCRAGVARFADADLAVRLAAARPWTAVLDGLSADLARPPVAAACRSVRRMLARHERTHEVPAAHGVPRRRAQALRRAARAKCRRDARPAVERLVGCGAGLTPAGDDLIVGMLAGLRATAGTDSRRRAFVSELGVIVRAVGPATNPVSRAYLEHAADGHFAEPLATLARHIADGPGDGPSLRSAARSALAVGATSGGDGVHGLLLGLTAWAGTDEVGLGARDG